jgi:Flp pilus assembly protein TadG
MMTMLRRFLGAKESQRGTVLLEFAVAAPTLIILIFAIIDFGRAMFTYDMIGNAAKIGARYAIVRGTTCSYITSHVTPCPAANSDISTYVQSKSPVGGLTVSTTWGPGVGTNCPTVAHPTSTTYQAPGCLVSVAVSYAFKFIWFPGLTVQMHSQSEMTIVQ